MTTFDISKSAIVRAIRAARAASDMAWIVAKEKGIEISNSNMENTVSATVKMVNLKNYNYNKNGVQHVISLDDVSSALEKAPGNIQVEIGNDGLYLDSILVNYSENRAIPIPPDMSGVRTIFEKDVVFPNSVLFDTLTNTIAMWGEDKKSRIVCICSDSGIFFIKYSTDWDDQDAMTISKRLNLSVLNKDTEPLYFDAAKLLKMSQSFPSKSKISMRWFKDVVGEFVVNLDDKCSVVVDIGQIVTKDD